MAGRAYRVWCCIPFGGEVDGEGSRGWLQECLALGELEMMVLGWYR